MAVNSHTSTIAVVMPLSRRLCPMRWTVILLVGHLWFTVYAVAGLVINFGLTVLCLRYNAAIESRKILNPVPGYYLQHWFTSLKCIFSLPVVSEWSPVHIQDNLTFQVNKISHGGLKPNTILTHGYIKEAEQYTEYANDNCLAGCLDWLCVTVWSPG